MSNKTIHTTSQAQKLAQDILRLSSNMLCVRLRFLDLALGGLRPCCTSGDGLVTDGADLYYSAEYILRRYKAGQDRVAKDLLHLLLHCVLRHMFVGAVIPELWDLACDMAVERIILELHLFSSPEDAALCGGLEAVWKDDRCMTAERLYRQLREHPPGPERLAELSRMFGTDDHRLWYRQNAGGLSDGDSTRREDMGFGRNSATAEERWKALGQRMRVDLETSSKQWGDTSSSLRQSLGLLDRRRYDYAAFLKRFAVPGEAIRVNDDEFDQIFYTYGLQMYGCVPLIEPLEYKELRLIREFVVAIDTSGSVEGQLVQKFLQKTYHLLLDTESFFSKIDLHLIQCDAEIQKDIKITCQADLDRCMAEMTLQGFGGTDYRPVFAYVDSLIRKREFTNLKGLIYFTDGYGTFPSQKPAYDTAFVFIGQEEHPKIPPWAIQLVLAEEELEKELDASPLPASYPGKGPEKAW